jgi:hypothetical protein
MGKGVVHRSSNSLISFFASPFSIFKLSITRSRPLVCSPFTEATVPALVLVSLLFRLGTGDIIGTTPIDDDAPIITGFNLPINQNT